MTNVLYGHSTWNPEHRYAEEAKAKVKAHQSQIQFQKVMKDMTFRKNIFCLGPIRNLHCDWCDCQNMWWRDQRVNWRTCSTRRGNLGSWKRLKNSAARRDLEERWIKEGRGEETEVLQGWWGTRNEGVPNQIYCIQRASSTSGLGSLTVIETNRERWWLHRERLVWCVRRSVQTVSSSLPVSIWSYPATTIECLCCRTC